MDRDVIALLRYAHGAYNLIVFILVLLMLWAGLGIRKARLSGVRKPNLQRFHRRLGPYAVVLGLAGFLAGIMLVLLDTGELFKYPPHLGCGALIVIGLIIQWRLSRLITASDDANRARHRRVGLTLATIYTLQVLIGFGVLF